MKAISVIPLKKGIFKEDLTYFSTKDIPNGSIVAVPIRNKKTLGLTIANEDIKNIKSTIKNLNFDLKKIIEVKEKSVFREEFLESVLSLSDYFVINKSNFITKILPSSLRENYDKISKIKNSTLNIKISNEKEEIELLKIKSEKLLYQAPFSDRISYYKTLIRESFARKRSVFIVLPTEHNIDNFVKLLSKGIENFTFEIHGNLSPKKQIDKFEKIISSIHPVLIIGTVPFLSLPRYDLETIIIENESSSSYKTIGNKTHIDLKIIAELFAVKIKAKLIFGDTLLRFETIARKNIENISEIHPLSFRINFDGKIKIPKKEEKFKILTEESITEIQNTLLKNKNVFIFSLRKGLATTTICRDCGEVLSCENCFAPIVLYLSRDNKKRMFVCNKCGKNKNPETICPACESWNLVPLGIGTDTVYEELKNIFPNKKIFKLDKEIAKTTTQAEKIISEFENSKGSILIGTEMALFYIKEKIPLSIIASFDSLWSIPNFKMSEKVVQLLISLLSKTENKLLIETRNEEDSAILSILNENLLSFVRDELNDRKNLEYPPYKKFIKITFLGDKEQTVNAKKIINELLKDYNPEIFSGFLSKQNNKYITNILIKVEPNIWSLPEILSNSKIDPYLFEKLNSLPSSFFININPEDLL